MVPTALFYGGDQWADEMQLDCISETLMVALLYGSHSCRALEHRQVGVSVKGVTVLWTQVVCPCLKE